MGASRREFAKRLAVAAVAVPLLDAAPAGAQTAQAPSPPPGTQNIRVGEAQTSVLRARYGQHLTPADIRKIEENLEGLAGYMRRMHEVELQNHDEPDTIFFAMGRDAQ
jgi:hypothetical protein